MAELRLENLSKIYPGPKGKPPSRALVDFSLELEPGECVALLGPSGAGKSTILRLVAGLDSPTGGDIRLGNESLTARAPKDRQIGMAFQYPALLPQLTAGENMRLGPKLRGLPEDRKWFDALVSSLEVAHLLARKPETLSGGEQQRIALGRALATRPQLLLLDEPLANLDPLSRVDLRNAIRRLQKDLRITTLYVTHDQAEAADVADRIALMREGRLEQFDSAEKLYLDPTSLFVARFFGPNGLNVLEGTVGSGGGVNYLQRGALRLPLSFASTQRVDTKVFAAFRPTSVLPRKDADPQWTVVEKRPLGWTTLLRLSHQTDEILCQLEDAGPFQEKELVSLEIDPGKTFFFDAPSGHRIKT